MSQSRPRVDPEKVAVGERVLFTHGPGNYRPVEYRVRQTCEENQGHWFCVSHDLGALTFPNNWHKDGHLDQCPNPRLGWMCHRHGPEVP